ncbi:hypothetical protein [Collinsella intestinalis]|uniref:hypothetical protein n=1 Tax=Collinsella intestinalis TaxID=147207 RepID=UPI0025A3F2ED|nr:hypothetical protein [Collinsella intestinalis]MDM8162447.1 hypothetical protein [Collinsella intestinalis]
MKQIYVVKGTGFRPSVAFNDRERAEAVRAMCGCNLEEVPLIDAQPSAIEALDAVADALALFDADDGDSDDGEGADDGDGEDDGL